MNDYRPSDYRTARTSNHRDSACISCGHKQPSVWKMLLVVAALIVAIPYAVVYIVGALQ